MKIKVLLLTLILVRMTAGWAQPNWTVNESDFQYSMTLIARINVDGRMLENSNDRVGAFVNGQVRGVAAPSFVAAQNKYFTYLTIFSNQQGETINFRLYDASTNSTRSVEMTLRFVANKHTGSFFQSVSIADPPLNTAAAFERFGFVNVPLNDSIIQPPNYTYYIPNIISKETLIPVFTLSDGATAHIDRRDQISGESQVDFTQPVIYQVLSEDQSTLNTYTFTIEHSFNDYDGDGLEDEFDLDDDDDCFSDLLEERLGTNPLDAADKPADADGDCIPDVQDDDVDNDGYDDDTIFVNEFFSPNGDGINDQWVIVNIERFTQSHLWVYTRTGQLVLDVTNYQNDWGGTLQGQDLPEGNYYYRIDQYGSGQISLEGWVYMSR